MEFDDLLLEKNLSSLTPFQVSRIKLRVDRKTVLIVVPDTNVQFNKTVNDLGFLLTTCRGIISPNKSIMISKRRFNGRLQYLDLKKKMVETKHGKKLRVMASIPRQRNTDKTVPTQKKDSTFYFYDMTLWSNALKYMNEKFSEKMTATRFFNELTKTYQGLKQSHPNINFELLFILKDNTGVLFNILKNIRRFIPLKQLSEIMFFDNYGLVAYGNNVIIPLFYKEKLKSKLIVPNIVKMEKYLPKPEEIKEINNSSAISDKTTETKPKTEEEVMNDLTVNNPSDVKSGSVLTKIVQNLQKEKSLRASIDDEGNIKTGIDNRQLTKVLKKYKINDPDIVANVKAAMDVYMEQKGGKPTKDEAEGVVLKAINYSVHGKEEIDDKYLADPGKLIRKVSTTQTHKTDLALPDNDTLIDGKDIIDIRHTSGVWRQKDEFEHTIHSNIKKLFKSISDTPNNPIKIMKIKHKVLDDDVNRFLLYEVTLKNTSGKNKKAYTVELKVPSPVNDRYFKIHGNNYIMATQQFLKPVTKTDSNEVRILSNYAIIHVGVKNLKFNPSNVDEVIEYIRVRYPNLIKNLKETQCEFKDGSIIYLSGKDVYTSKERSFTTNPDTNKIVDNQGNEVTVGKSEFLYELLLQKIQKVNPEDNLTRTKKTIPYIYIYLSGITIPLIVYMWQLKGLISTLSDFGIDYELTSEPTTANIVVPTKDKYLVVKPKSIREKLIANGLLAARFKATFNDLNDPNEVHPYIDQTYGSGAVRQIANMNRNQIDPVTKELLEFENLPTTLPNLASTYCIDVLLNKKPDSLSDLKIYRARLSEQILTIMYKQIQMAHNTYSSAVEFGDENAQIRLDPDYIINNLITESGVLQYAEIVNPVDEIFEASRTINKCGFIQQCISNNSVNSVEALT